MKRTILALVAALCAASSHADKVTLVSDAVAKCRVITAPDASYAEKFASRELQKYLSKATTCGKLDGQLPITIRVKKLKGLNEDGYLIDVKKDGIEITGYNPRGTLYATYHILKKYAGMRWLVPNDDGEYCVLKGKSVSMPCGQTLVNPFAKVRVINTHYGSAPLWEIRNGYVPQAIAGWYYDKKNPGVISARGIAAEEVGSASHGTGGHLMSALMYGNEWGTTRESRNAFAKKFFKEHPEWFALINGKRHLPKPSNENEPNPCLSNPALLDRMAENLLERIKGPYGAVGHVTIGNNDTTKWCECEKCRALDAPEAVTQGERADRYWWVINELTKRVWKVRPDAKLGGWAYQNFWFPPCRVKPDKKLSVLISFNCQCWRHSLDDNDCSVNRALREVYMAWKKLDMPLISNRDEIACIGSPGSDYLPSESVVANNIRCFGKFGCAGSHYCLFRPPMEPEFCSWERNMWPFYGKNLRWSAMWQTLYLAGIIQWNPDADFEANWEECNAIYYGKGWEGGFREFKKLQTKLFLETPGCISLGMPDGMCGFSLDSIGSENKLIALLKRAEAAAAKDPDPRALIHVKRDREIFEMSWVDAAKKRRDLLGSFDVYEAESDIKIDAITNERDWKLAERRPFFCGKRANLQVVWRKDELLFAAEWENGPIEIAFEYPDGTDRTASFTVMPSGKIVSPIKGIKAKVRKDGDVRKLEALVPLKSLMWQCRAGGNWKVRVDAPKSNRGFVQMRFLPKRQGVFKVEKTYPYWRNATFDEGFPTQKIAKAQQWVNWKNTTTKSNVVPRPWGSPQAYGETKEHKHDPGNFYVTILPAKECTFSQGLSSPQSGKMILSFRARGKGSVRVWTASYIVNEKTKLINDSILSKTFKLSDEWKTYTLEFEKLGVEYESKSIRFFAVDAPVDIDDAFVNPL
jgi:hypothetical protein